MLLAKSEQLTKILPQYHQYTWDLKFKTEI